MTFRLDVLPASRPRRHPALRAGGDAPAAVGPAPARLSGGAVFLAP